jgi:hypothetical protein
MRILPLTTACVCLWLLAGTLATAAEHAPPPLPTPTQDAAPAAKPAAAPADPDAGISTASDDAPTPPAKAAAAEAKKDDKAAAPKTETPKTETPKKPKSPPPRKELTPAQVEFRDRIRRTLEIQYQQPFNTRDNTAADLIKYCWAFGCRSEVERGDAPGQKANAITCLCWDLPCGGYHLLAAGDGHLAARVGYGLQDDPGQFLAMLALAYVPADYAIRAGTKQGTVADLVEAEKRDCRAGTDMSLKLIGLCHYADEAAWQNSLGETWSIEKIVESELSRPAIAGPGGITRLLGLSRAVTRRVNASQPLDGAFGRAKVFVDDYQNYVLRTQNSDGSWRFRPLASQAADRDYALQFLQTGQVAEWLALSLPAARLDEPVLVRSIAYLDTMLNSERYRWNVQAMSGRDMAAVAHAAHALAAYDARVFRPAEGPEKPAPEKGQEGKPVVTASGGQANAAVQ